MKKKELAKGVVGLQPETDEDFDYLVKNNSLLFYLDREKKYHCLDYVLRIDLLFDDTKNEWVEVPYNMERESEDVDFDKTLKRFKDHLPYDTFQKVRDERAKKEQETFENERLNTPRRVIGWAGGGIFRDCGCDEDHYFALLNDIIDKGYYFTGDVMELCPVFDDYTSCSFSSRGWGGVIAASRGEFDEMSYSKYAWMWDDDEGFHLPKEGAYIEEDECYVNLNQEQWISFDKAFGRYCREEKKKIVYFLQVNPEEAHLKWGQFGFDLIEVRRPGSDEKYHMEIHDAVYISSVETFDSLVDDYAEMYNWKYEPIPEEDILRVTNRKKIEELLKKGPVFLLVLVL